MLGCKREFKKDSERKKKKKKWALWKAKLSDLAGSR